MASFAIFTALPAVAQNTAYKPARTADGKPDLNGILAGHEHGQLGSAGTRGGGRACVLSGSGFCDPARGRRGGRGSDPVSAGDAGQEERESGTPVQRGSG